MHFFLLVCLDASFPLVWDEVTNFLTSPKILEEMRNEIEARSKNDEGMEERNRLKAKISGPNYQLDALTERLSMLPKAVSPASFFKQMEKIEFLKIEMEEKLLNENKATSVSSQRFVKPDTFERFSDHWKPFLFSANEEMRKKIIHKFVRKIEIGKNEITIHWLVDEDHYNGERSKNVWGRWFVQLDNWRTDG